MKKINWGIISTGNIANSFAQDFKYSKGGILLAVASRSLARAIAFKEKYKLIKAYGSYEELYNDPDVDVVYIATPHNFHLQNATDALRNGKAVLCEKPITLNPNEFRMLMDVANATGNYLMEAMWTYFLPPIIKAKKWVEEGKIGAIYYVKADFGFKGNIEREPRLYNPEFGGGALLDIGIYPIALAWLIYDKSPISIYVTSKKTHTGVDGEETMIFKYSNGATASLASSILFSMPNEALIIGEKGYIRIPDFFMARECYLYLEDVISEHYEDKRKSVGYNYEIDAVNQDLNAGKKQSDIMPLEYSLRIQEIMDTVKRKF